MSPTTPPAPFIVGVPRSGTTLLRLMLDAHPDLAIPAETHFLPALIRTWRRMEADGADEAERRRQVFELITDHRRWPDWGIEADALMTELERRRPLTLADAARSVHLVHAAHQGKPRWGDKSTAYLARMPRIQSALPEARFVHLVRDGRDVALSLAEVSWGTDDLEQAARQWAEGIGLARRRAARLTPDSYMEARYEDLVSDPEPVLRRICELIDLGWDPAMLRYHEQAAERMSDVVRDVPRVKGGVITAEERARQHELVAGPPTTERTARWRAEMPDPDRRRFEELAGEMLRDLGYETGDA